MDKVHVITAEIQLMVYIVTVQSVACACVAALAVDNAATCVVCVHFSAMC